MKKVLIVDDDRVLRSLFSHVLKKKERLFEVVTAKDGQQAINVIKNTKIDLVLTDLYMPVLNGFELIAYMSKHYPNTPVYAMSAKASQKNREKADMLGSLKFISKPVQLDDLAQIIQEEFYVKTKGYISGVTLPSFMKLIAMEEKTCTITVKTEYEQGKIYFVEGTLTAAETRYQKKEEAVLEMITWDDVIVEFDERNVNKVRDIKLPVSHLVVEGLQRKNIIHNRRKAS